jgi:hypothetical protein
MRFRQTAMPSNGLLLVVQAGGALTGARMMAGVTNRQARLIGSAIFPVAGAHLLRSAGAFEKLCGLSIVAIGSLAFLGEWLVSVLASDFWDQRVLRSARSRRRRGRR